MNRLMGCLDIPLSVERKIREHSKDEEQQREECIYYWMNVSPDSIIGWGFLGGELHSFRYEAALRAANEYIQRAPGTCGCGMCMYWNVDHAYITQQIHACSDVHCVCSSAFVDYTDAHTDHICAHVHLHTHTHTLTHTHSPVIQSPH